MTIADLLTQSRAAHARAKAAESAGSSAAGDWQEAHTLRQSAHQADPEHTDPAWLEDALHPAVPGEIGRRYHRVPGLSVQAVAQQRHEDLLAYYAVQLGAGAVLGVVDRTTRRAHADRVSAPDGMEAQDSAAMAQLQREEEARPISAPATQKGVADA